MASQLVALACLQLWCHHCARRHCLHLVPPLFRPISLLWCDMHHCNGLHVCLRCYHCCRYYASYHSTRCSCYRILGPSEVSGASPTHHGPASIRICLHNTALCTGGHSWAHASAAVVLSSSASAACSFLACVPTCTAAGLAGDSPRWPSSSPLDALGHWLQGSFLSRIPTIQALSGESTWGQAPW